MSIYGLPLKRIFWKREMGVQKIMETMTRNHWEQIESKLHFNDNSQYDQKNKDIQT